MIFFFDDDVDLDKNYLIEVEKIFVGDTSQEIGAVGGRITKAILETLRLQIELRVFGFLRSVFGVVGTRNGKFYPSGMPSHPHRNQPSGFIECLSGCCMAFRREVFEKARFDEALAHYGLMEDVDISKQVIKSIIKPLQP